MGSNFLSAHKPLIAALLFFSFACLLAVGLGVQLQARQQAEKVRKFSAVANRVSTQLQTRIGKYELGLRGARGAVIAGGYESIPKDVFRQYMSSLDIAAKFPGSRGFGFIRRVLPEQEAEFVAAARKDGKPDFNISQLSPHSGERLVIVFIEPETDNRAAIGLDIASERNRKEAAIEAIEQGEAVLTRPITLVQASGKPRRGFLLLLAVYRPGVTPGNQAQRMNSAIGLVYTPLLIDEVLAEFDYQDGEFAIAIDEADQYGNWSRFFTYTNHSAPIENLAVTIPLSVYGRHWRLEVKPLPKFVETLNLTNTKQVIVALIGLSGLIALLLYGFLLNRFRQRQGMFYQAHLAVIVESSRDAIISVNLDGMVTSWNTAAEQIFGYRAAQAVGWDLAGLIIPDGYLHQEWQTRAKILREEPVADFTTIRLKQDGSMIDASITMFPIRSVSGRTVGVAEIIRDVTRQKMAEAQILEFNNNLERQVLQRTAELEAARRHLQNVLDSVPSVIGYWDSRLLNRVANHAYQEWFGIDENKISGMHIREALGEKFYQLNKSYFQRALEGKVQQYERTLPIPGSSAVRHCLVHYVPDKVGGQVKGFYSILHDVSEIAENRRQLTQALQENELLTRAVNEHLLYSVTDKDGRIRQINDNFCSFSGYSAEELIGYNHNLLSSGLHANDFWEQMWDTVKSGRAWRAEVCNRAKDGHLYWVDIVIAPVMGERDAIDRYISMSIDITSKKMAVAELNRVNEVLENVLRAATRVAIIAADVNGIIQLFNSGAERMLGYSAQETIGKFSPLAFHDPTEIAQRATELSHEYDRTITGFDVLVYKAERDGSEHREWTYISKHGEPVSVTLVVTPMLDAQGRINGYLGIAQDVTELKKQQATIRNMLESSPVAVRVAVDNGSRVVFANQRFAELLHIERSHVTGIDVQKYYVDKQVFNDLFQQLRAGKAVIDRMVQLHNPDFPEKGAVWTLASFMPMEYEGQPAVLAWFYDVTELRNAKVAAEQANLAKSSFLANMSHEIRTPMNAVLALVQLLEQERLLPSQREMVIRIRQAGNSLLAIINDILDFSKIDAGELRIDEQAFNLDAKLQHIDNLMSSLADNKNLLWQVHRQADVPVELLGDCLRLEQILINFVGNAIKFTERGEVNLSVSLVERIADTAILRFEVRDTGIGIAEQDLQALFSPFTQADTSYTRKFGGTGLGLSISKRLVELMDGRIGVNSRLGFGSLFWFEVPFKVTLPKITLLPDVLAAKPAKSLAGKRILVVDDSEMNLEVVKRILHKENAQTVFATDGIQAVNALKAEPGGFDAVLMDVQMPIMDGIAATRAIRNELNLKDLPVLAFSAGVMSQERKAIFDAGITDFIPKPVDINQLKEALLHCIGENGQTCIEKPVQAESKSFPHIDGIDKQRAESQMDGDLEFFATLLGVFIDNHRHFVELIKKDLANGEIEAAAVKLHKLRGAAGSVSAMQVVERSSAAEKALRTGAPNADALLDQFYRQFEELLHAASAWLKGQAAS